MGVLQGRLARQDDAVRRLAGLESTVAVLDRQRRNQEVRAGRSRTLGSEWPTGMRLRTMDHIDV